jgi:hypothetical protein
VSQADPVATTHSLTELPEGSKLRAVTAVPPRSLAAGLSGVELTDAVTLEGKPGVDYVDMPTFVIIPASFTNGTIEVNILSRLNGRGPADASGLRRHRLPRHRRWRPVRGGLPATLERTEDEPAQPT